MPKHSLMAFVLGGAVTVGGLALGAFVYPAADGGPNWPLMGAAVVVGTLIEAAGLLVLAGRPPR